MISTLDLAWAAGFLEGEGSFGYYGCPRVTAAQVQREPIDKLAGLFGGSITQRCTKGFSKKPIWVWALGSQRSTQVMMTLYVLMSPKRQHEIVGALEKWKLSRTLRQKGSGVCANGHKLEGHNVMMVKHYVQCRACRNDGKQNRRIAARLLAA